MPDNDIDFTNDQNPDLFMWLDSKGAIPDYVMDSDVCEQSDFEKLASNAFADPQRRLYPVNTKEACWMSAAHYIGRGGNNPYILGNIEKMAAWHGISEDVRDVADLISDSFEKSASAGAEEPEEPEHALVLEDNNGDLHSYYPLNNGFEVITSSEKAASDFRSRALPLPYFHKVACNIMDAAGVMNVHPGDVACEVVRYGTRRLPDPYTGEVIISMRKSAGVDVAPYVSLIEALREGLEKAASNQLAMEAAEDVASRMFMLDSAHKINYGPGMVDPFTAIFSGPPEEDLNKFAATNVRLGGVYVPAMEIMNLSDRKLESSFSAGTAAIVKEAKALLDGEFDEEKCASASDKLDALSPEAQKVLLATLAGVAW